MDLGLVVADRPAVAAGVFTRNRVKAAPVLLDTARLQARAEARAILVNSGNANACTGPGGLADAEESCRLVAAATGVPADEVLVASTGVIGWPLPMDRIRQAIPELARGLSEDGLEAVSRAILTTDTAAKTAARALSLGGRDVTVAGMAKGAGMIGPDLGPPHATMLAFLFTDAPVEAPWWQAVLAAAAGTTFNRILVDGDTSTNDTVLALASGAAGGPPIGPGRPGAAELEAAVTGVCAELARRICLDGEGATKLVRVAVTGAPDDAAAERIARVVAASPLVKTACFGEDPNWGRVAAAAGRAGVPFDPGDLAIGIGGVEVVAGGRPTGLEAEERARAAMRGREFAVELRVGTGPGRAEILTTDLSVDYVRINADYRS
nr:bifunctional glutamate N-acetyltransferase/amino-acid acetyltransferase ArgJ [Dissulfurirhabdus thermomarina]